MSQHHRSGVAVLILVLLLFGATSASPQTPLSYSGPLHDAYGIQRSVSFSGQLNGSALSGTATVEGNAITVQGTLASDGSLSGSMTLASDGSLGTFQGRPDAQGNLGIVYSLGGTTAALTLPPGVAAAIKTSAAQAAAPAGQ